MPITEVPITNAVVPKEGKIIISGGGFASDAVPGPIFANNLSTSFKTVIPIPDDFDRTQTDPQVDVFLFNDAASSGNLTLYAVLEPIEDDEALSFNMGSQTALVAAEPGLNEIHKYTVDANADDWSTAVMMYVSISRSGNEGSDTGSEDTPLVGVAIRYKRTQQRRVDW